MRIGFFDSGHGGLDILQAAMKEVSGDYYFIADEKFHPYGAMKIDSLLERCHHLTDVLVNDKSCEIVVIACNTATVYGIEQLRKDFSVPFVGVEPYLNYINHAEGKLLREGSVGALVTPNTMRSERFEKLKKEKDPQDLVHVEAISQLAPSIEAFIHHRDKARFEKELNEMLEGKDFSSWQETILGCTHYPLVSAHLEKALTTKCVSPTPAIIRQIHRILNTQVPSSSLSQVNFQYWNTEKSEWQEAALPQFLPLPGE